LDAKILGNTQQSVDLRPDVLVEIGGVVGSVADALGREPALVDLLFSDVVGELDR